MQFKQRYSNLSMGVVPTTIRNTVWHPWILTPDEWRLGSYAEMPKRMTKQGVLAALTALLLCCIALPVLGTIEPDEPIPYSSDRNTP